MSEYSNLSPAPDSSADSDRALLMQQYRKAVEKVWDDMVMTVSEYHHLRRLQDTLGLPDAEAESIEIDITGASKERLYSEGFGSDTSPAPGPTRPADGYLDDGGVRQSAPGADRSACATHDSIGGLPTYVQAPLRESKTALRVRSLPSGMLIGGRFELIQKIGEGGMGCVYEVLDKDHFGERRALKVLDRRLDDSIKKEVAVGQRLTHRHIARVHDSGYDSDLEFHFFHMELIHGDSLRAWIESRRERPGLIQWREFLRIAEPVCEAIGYAHECGVIHRDLKPENIVVSSDLTTVKVMDFGLAKYDPKGLFLSRPDQIAGTPTYSAPEQLRGESSDHRSDIYSLSVVFYELLTGGMPVFGSPVLLDARPDMPVAAARVIEEGLRPSREERPSSVATFLRAFRDGTHWMASAQKSVASGDARAEEDLYAQAEFDRLSIAANRGDKDAMYGLAMAFEQGRGVAARPEDALRWFRRAADLGHPAAKFRVARSLIDSGRRVNDKEVVRLMQDAALSGLDEAQFWCGQAAYYGDVPGVQLDRKEAVRLWRASADQGHAAAACALATALWEGEGVAQDRSRALDRWKQGAERGSVDAASRLGIVLWDGAGVPRDRQAAIRWLHIAAAGGSFRAMDRLGRAYWSGEGVPEDSAEAISWWQKSAEAGSVEAAHRLAGVFWEGHHVDQDRSVALSWRRRAAEGGHQESQRVLGDLLWAGDSCGADPAAAIEWWSAAAEKGDVASAVKLGKALWNGDRIPRDRAAAIMWFRKAAEGGDPEGMMMLARSMLDEGASEDERREAEEWMLKAATAGRAGAQFAMGRSAAARVGSEAGSKPSDVLRWWRLAADQGHRGAMRLLGDALWSGEYGSEDKAHAVNLWGRAASSDMAAAESYAGALWSGEHVQRDCPRAIELWRSAAEAGRAMSAYRLGCVYWSGVDIPRDTAQATYWWRRAAEGGSIHAARDLGCALWDDKTGAPNQKEAVRWWRVAADGGDVVSGVQLGLALWEGQGVAADRGEAVKYWRAAADQGDESAALRLGIAEWHGDGCEQDRVSASRWFGLAATSGDPLSRYYLGLSQEGLDGVERQAGLAEANLRFAYANGVEGAGVALARLMIEEGAHSARLDEALKLIRQAAAKEGSAEAFRLLGVCYAEGLGVERRSDKAAKLFRKAAQLGDAVAQRLLGDMLRTGSGVARNRGEARRLMRLAASSGDAEAAEQLAAWEFVDALWWTAPLAILVVWSLWRLVSWAWDVVCWLAACVWAPFDWGLRVVAWIWNGLTGVLEWIWNILSGWFARGPGSSGELFDFWGWWC